MRLNDIIKVVFKNNNSEIEEIILTVDQLLDTTREDLYEMLESKHPCTSSGCFTESQNFCDCGPFYEDYQIVEIINIEQ